MPLGALPPAFRPLERPRVTLGFAYAAMIDAGGTAGARPYSTD